jgi:hypothetical protein
MVFYVLELRDAGPVLWCRWVGMLRYRNFNNARLASWGQTTGKKVGGRESLVNKMRETLTSQRNGLTVGTTTVPNLAYRGNVAGKSIPFSQTSAPPVMDPDSGFTSVRTGADCLSLPRGDIAWPRGIMSISDLGLEHALECS